MRRRPLMRLVKGSRHATMMTDVLRRMFLRTAYWLSAPIDRRAIARHKHAGSVASYGGIEIIFNATGDHAGALKRTADALRLIEAYDPVRWRRVRRGLRHVVIVTDTATMYVPSVDGCYLSAEAVRQQDTRIVSMAIVHEATHAEFWRRRFVAPPREQARRMELFCFREELSFVRKLPKSDEFAYWAEQRLQAAAKGINDPMEEILRGRGMPRWMLAVRRWLLP